MLKYAIMNCSCDFGSTIINFTSYCIIKNSTLIKISVLNLLHYWHLVPFQKKLFFSTAILTLVKLLPLTEMAELPEKNFIVHPVCTSFSNEFEFQTTACKIINSGPMHRPVPIYLQAVVWVPSEICISKQTSRPQGPVS